METKYEIPNSQILDGVSNFSASGGTRNLKTSSHLQHQHVDDVEMDMIKYLQPFKESSLLEQKTLKRHEVSLEDISSPRKKSKVLPSFDASMANDKIVGIWDSNMVLPYSTVGLPELQEQPESPFTKNNMDFPNLKQDSESKNTDEKIFGTKADLEEGTKSLESEKNAVKKGIEPNYDLEKGAKSSNPRRSVVSLIETFAVDQIRQHIMRLRQHFNQNISEEEKRIDDTSCCPLCGMNRLFFAPVPIYCLSCGKRIRKNSKFHYGKAQDLLETQEFFCNSCYRNSRGQFIKFNGVSVSKATLGTKRNDYLNEEGWAQCDKCKRWVHQICALFNNKSNLESKEESEYVCPQCCLDEIEKGIRAPLPENATFGAKDLPRTKLSDHIEQRLFSRLQQERANMARHERKNVDEILGAENLVVRVVSSVDKKLEVKKPFLDILCEENYPAEFPYRSKVILLFQKIEGVDICLFGMYVQEYGSDCGYPNQRCVYISYIDSVKHFRPQRETGTGEALRTFVYHEILIGYLEFCKKRGFATCYIWSCPPRKGEDFVLYCHPENQKTPKKDKLRQWYRSMLRKASKENIVVGFTNIYDLFFNPSGNKLNFKVTASNLPYFDGDYWSSAAIDLMKNIENESKGDYTKMVNKVLSKRAIKGMGHHLNPSEGTTKDILVMHKLGQNILPYKEDFMVVQLQYICKHCHEAILSGKRWFCSVCKDYQQCERCHTIDTHTSLSGEKHTLYQVVDDIPLDTKENDDIILDNDLFKERHNFLKFCQNNQIQFDTLRRAKHSSMMILYHLMAPPSSRLGSQELKEKRVQRRKNEILELLKHASKCHSKMSQQQPCPYENCVKIKKLFCHASKCDVRASRGCKHCKKVWKCLFLHSRICKDQECHVPRCKDLKEHMQKYGYRTAI